VSIAPEVEISVVVPIWNDEESIRPFLLTLVPLLEASTASFEIIFCVDPSSDGTEQTLIDFSKSDARIKALFFAARCGQPASTVAGLTHSNGAAVIVIDVDLQDPLNLIPVMIERWRGGELLLIPRRSSRRGEPYSKRMTAALGYNFLSRFAVAPIPRNTGDYRLMDRTIVSRVLCLRETHIFLRGLVALVDQNPSFIEFERPPRALGKTKYNKWFGGIKSGLNGIVSYSSALLDWLIVIGTMMALVAFGFGTKLAISKIMGSDIPPGNTQLFVMVTFIGGIQLVGLGIVGLYIGRIFEETKLRPRWFIKQGVGIKELDLYDSLRSDGVLEKRNNG
jgi:dolichol-phosphate mannosyltransferase